MDLYRAVFSGHLEQLRELLNNGADPNLQKSSASGRPLHYASSRGWTEGVVLLLAAEAALDVRNDCGETPLHLACRGGHAEVAALLLAARADPTAANLYGDTPLHLTSMYGSVACTASLLEAFEGNKEILNAKDINQGFTALHDAAQRGHVEIAKLLLLAGANPAVENKAGEVPADMTDNAELQAIFATFTRSKNAAQA